MNAALFLIIGCAVLVVGYIFYGGWLAKKWGVDNSRPTPAHTMEDGKDFRRAETTKAKRPNAWVFPAKPCTTN